jgi:hypothetical protein
MILRGKTKKLGKVIILALFCFMISSRAPTQVTPIPPDQTKGQVKPLPFEEPAVKKV